MSIASRAFAVIRRLGIIIAIGLTFLFGLATTVYLSLRSPEVTVPEVLGKDRFDAERVLRDAGLNYRVRATRPSNKSKPDTVLFQLPRAGDVVKVGQTVAMDISRAAKEGEAAEGAEIDKKIAEGQAESTASNANENRARRKVNANANANGNKNSNENAASNANVANRNAEANQNVNRGSVPNANASRTPNVNARPNNNANTGDTEVPSPARNQNSNSDRRPPAPRPSPAARNTNTQP